MKWQELTTDDFHAVRRTTPVVLPMAAIEQHGPHLPLATDRMIAEFFADELDSQLGKNVLTLPCVPVGCSEHHMSFPGSLTLRHETFVGVGEQYLQAAWRHGFRRFLVLNAHGGNQGACQVLVERFGAEHPDSCVAAATWWRTASEALRELNDSGPGGVGHACEFETSLMLLIAPNLVRMELAPPRANVPTFEWAEGDLLRGPAVSMYRTMRQMTPTGVYGEPRHASAEKGKRIAEIIAEALVQIVLDLDSEAK